MKGNTKSQKLIQVQKLLEEIGLEGINIHDLIEQQDAVKNSSKKENGGLTKLNGFSIKQKVFIAAYKKSLGNITQAAKAAKVVRQTYNYWRDTNQEFADFIDGLDIKNLKLDLWENGMHSIALDKNHKDRFRALKYLLGTQGKERGYIENPDVEPPDEKDRVILFVPDNGRDSYEDAVVLDPKGLNEKNDKD